MRSDSANMPPPCAVFWHSGNRSIVPTGRYLCGCGKADGSFGLTTKSDKKNSANTDPAPNAKTAASKPSTHVPCMRRSGTHEAIKKPASTPTNEPTIRLGRDSSSCARHEGHANSSDFDNTNARGTFAKHSGHARFPLASLPYV